jgi:hypothetical protein
MKRLLLAFALAFLWTVPVSAAGTLPRVNVLEHGVVGDGVTDDRAAIQNVLDNVVMERGTVYFPARHYYVSGTIDCGGRAFNFRGDGRPMPYSIWQIPGTPPTILGGTFIRGNFAGPLLRSVYPAGMLSIEDMGFSNWHASGQGLLLSGSNVALLRVSVNAYRAIEMAPSAFTVSMQQIVVRWSGNTPGSVGIAIRGHALLHGADIVGFDVGLRLAGIGNDLRSLRVEVNRIGIELGVNPDGTTNQVLGSSIESLSLEANDYGIVTRAATSISVRNVLIQGSVNSPSAGSKVGLLVHHSQWAHYEQVIASGNYTEAAIRVSASQPTTVPLRFTLCKANNVTPGGVQWDYVPQPNLVLEQCN